jgi:hypothetical protein
MEVVAASIAVLLLLFSEDPKPEFEAGAHRARRRHAIVPPRRLKLIARVRGEEIRMQCARTKLEAIYMFLNCALVNGLAIGDVLPNTNSLPSSIKA